MKHYDDFSLVRLHFEEKREDWGTGQLILHLNKRRKIPWAKISANTGVSIYRLRKTVALYLDGKTA